MLESTAERLPQAAPSDAQAARQAALAGDEFFKREMLPEALERYVCAMQMNPGEAIYCFNVGFVNWRLGKLEAAQHHVERAIALSPGVARFHQTLSQIHFDRLQIPLALHYARCAWELAPTDPEITLFLASMLEADGQAEAALKVVQPLLERGPHSNGLAMVMARIAPRLGLQEQAI